MWRDDSVGNFQTILLQPVSMTLAYCATYLNYISNTIKKQRFRHIFNVLYDGSAQVSI